MSSHVGMTDCQASARGCQRMKCIEKIIQKIILLCVHSGVFDRFCKEFYEKYHDQLPRANESIYIINGRSISYLNEVICSGKIKNKAI